LFVSLVLVATGAGVYYYTKHHTLPLIGHNAPPPDPARDLVLATSTVVQPADLPGWTVHAPSAPNPFAMGASSSAKAGQVSAAASTDLAVCLQVSPSTLSAATGASGATVPDRTVSASSHVFVKPGDGSLAGSEADVMSSTSDVQADAKVFSNGGLFATCYEPYVQSMLPYLSAITGPGQTFDTATVAPLGIQAPPAHSGVHAYGFQITLLGHSGNTGVTMVLDDVAVFGGRTQANLSMSSSLVFPVDTQGALVQSTEARVAAVAGR
jgi:hypothetical protein